LSSLTRALVGDRPRQTLIRIVVLVLAAYVVFGHVLLPVRGQGPSMLPTMTDGQLVFVNRLAYWRRPPDRGDIVALSLAGRRVVYVKRVIGLPGERLRIDEGSVFIDGNVLVEPYVVRRSAWNVPEVALGADEYFLIGDNRSMPERLHDFGRARRDRIIGRLVTAR
jgi:signal peptidase I